MRPPRKAIVLSAGYGARMRPLTVETPKPLLPLWNRPILGYVLDTLRRWGVEEVLLNLHHHPSAIVGFVTEHFASTLRVTFSYEPAILGTGGCAAAARWFTGRDKFWLVNSDLAFDIAVSPVLNTWRGDYVALLCVTDRTGPRTVTVEDGLVTDFRSSQAGRKGTYTFCGIQLVSPAIYRHMPKDGRFSIVDAYEAAIRAGAHVAAIPVRHGFWMDIGQPDSYIDAHRATRCRRMNRYARIFAPRTPATGNARRFACVSKSAKVGPGARIVDSIVMEHAHVAPGAHLENCIVGPGCRVSGHVTGIAVRADAAGHPALSDVMCRMDLHPATCSVTLLPERGSARRFYRIQAGSRSWIAIEYGLERPENALFVQNARFLAGLGVRVPEVVLVAESAHIVVVEDLGHVSLQDYVARHHADSIRRMYIRVLQGIRHLHRFDIRRLDSKRLTLSPPFSLALYRWEHELFARHFLGNHIGTPESSVRPVLDELLQVANVLRHEPQALIHRDLQSSNVLLTGTRPAFIDFQGMRIGPVVYDLASLLCDPYVSLPEKLQQAMVRRYAVMSYRDADDLVRLFWLASVQRLVQAIGAYARMAANPGTSRFAQHIPPALSILNRALAHAGRSGALPHTRELVHRILQNS